MDASSRRVGRGGSAMPRIYPGYGDESSSIAPSSAHPTTITTGTSLPSSQPPSSVGITKKSQAIPVAPPPSSESMSSSRAPFISAPTQSRAPTSDISASSFSSGPVPASSIPTAYTAPQYPTLRSPTTSASSFSSSVPIAAPQPIIAPVPVPALAPASAPPPAVVRVPPSILVNSNSHSMPNPSPYSQIVPRSSIGRREPPGRSGMPSRVPTTEARESRATARRERERDVGQPSSPVLTRSRRAGDTSNPTVTSTTTATRSRRTGAGAPTSPRTPGPAGYRTIAPSSTNTRTRTRTRTGTTAVTTSSARRRKLRKEALDRRLLQTTIALVFVAIVVVMMFDRSAFRGWLWGEEDALGGIGSGRSRSGIFGGHAEPRVDMDDDLFAWPGSVSQSSRSHADKTGGQGRETTTQTRVEHDDNSEGDERPLSMPRTPAPVAPPPSHPHPPHESAEELSTAVGPRVPNSSSVSFFDPQRVWEYMQSSSPPPSSPPPPPFYDSNSRFEEQASSRAMRVPRVREIMGPNRVDDGGARRVERLHGGKRELREMYGLGYEAGAPYGNENEEAQAVGLWQRIGGGQ